MIVVNYVFETPESLADLRRQLLAPDETIHAFRLVASDAAIEAPIRQREQESDADLRWHLKRYQELVAIQERAAARGDLGLVVDITGLSAAEVADLIWRNLRGPIDIHPVWVII